MNVVPVTSLYVSNDILQLLAVSDALAQLNFDRVKTFVNKPTVTVRVRTEASQCARRVVRRLCVKALGIPRSIHDQLVAIYLTR